jgi:hypothetical protein
MKKFWLMALLLGVCLVFATGCIQLGTPEEELEIERPSAPVAIFEKEDFALIDGALAATSISEGLAEGMFGLRADFEEYEWGEDEKIPGIGSGAELVRHNGREEALVNLIERKVDIIFIMTRPADEEIKRLQERAYVSAVHAAPYGAYVENIWDVDLEFTPVAHDAIVFLTGRGNPVNDLTKGQVHDIFSGRITKWSGV